MKSEEKAISLLKEWRKYSQLHYSCRATFSDAIDIELERDTVSECANLLMVALTTENHSVANIKVLIKNLDKHLTSFKNKMTIELLKHGINID